MLRLCLYLGGCICSGLLLRTVKEPLVKSREYNGFLVSLSSLKATQNLDSSLGIQATVTKKGCQGTGKSGYSGPCGRLGIVPT